MKVKIIKASEDIYWYANHIGEKFEVEEGTDKDTYLVIDSNVGVDYYIDKNDCEIIEGNVELTKPPLGVMPKYIFEEKRIQDICRALYEYSIYNIKNINIEWIEELLERLNNYNT